MIDAESFWCSVSKTRDCWNWSGLRDTDGDPVVVDHGRRIKAARVAYTLTVGDLPDDALMRRLCRNPLCVNPRHFEVRQSSGMFERVDKAKQADVAAPRRTHNHARGEDHYRVKLNAHDVLEIREASAKGEPATRLATRYGMSRGAIYKIIVRENWANVAPGPEERRGSRRPLRAKLTDAQIEEICRRKADGAGTGTLALAYGVARQTITKVVRQSRRRGAE